MAGRSLNMHAANLLGGCEGEDISGCLAMHGGHACLMTAFAEAVAVAWAASTPMRGSEPEATDTGSNGSAGLRRVQQQEPSVQAALTFALLLCMATLGAEAVDHSGQLLSSILLVCIFCLQGH